MDLQAQTRKRAHVLPDRSPTYTQFPAEPFAGAEMTIGKQLDNAMTQNHCRSLTQGVSAMPLSFLAFSLAQRVADQALPGLGIAAPAISQGTGDYARCAPDLRV
jgi:hypothetical protein